MCFYYEDHVGSMAEHQTLNQVDGGNLGNFVYPTCFSEETLKAGGLFYLVSMPGEVKDPTQGVNV